MLEAPPGQGAICRPGRGRAVAGDKGCGSPTARARPRRRGIRPVIPSKGNERHRPHCDRAAHRLRNRIERSINRLKQFRRIATRYETLAVDCLAMLRIGTIMPWL